MGASFRIATTVHFGTGLIKMICLSAGLLAAANAPAQETISTDVAAPNGLAGRIEDHVAAYFQSIPSTASISNLDLPTATDIAALHVAGPETLLFTLKSAAQLGPLAARAGEVLRWQNGSFDRVVSGAELGLGPATGIDALTMQDETLIFSTDIADTIDGVAVSDSDLLAWQAGGPAELLQDQSVCGIPDTTDLAGVQLLDDGQFLMTFSNGAEVGGIAMRKGDILRCNPADGTVVLETRFADLGSAWAAVGLDAVSRGVLDQLFKDSFEVSNP